MTIALRGSSDLPANPVSETQLMTLFVENSEFAMTVSTEVEIAYAGILNYNLRYFENLHPERLLWKRKKTLQCCSL